MRLKLTVVSLLIILMSCSNSVTNKRIPVLFDSDANNELDDQHALAYLLFSQDVFDIKGITVNRTFHGGDIESQAEEAERVIALCGMSDQFKVYRGADKSFEEIKGSLSEADFDGKPAVDFIIRQVHENQSGKLVLLPVGKLTNIALAVEKDPSIIPKVKVVWLGSNYPDPGEYNQDNDEGAMNYLLNTDVEFEMVTVRGGKDSGTAAVTASIAEIQKRMPGLGPAINPHVVGRHEESHACFGDYSISLFEHARLFGEHKVRSLFDMAAVAVVKNPAWAGTDTIPAPILVERKWQERPGNSRKIVVWENFDKEAIMTDFYTTLENAK